MINSLVANYGTYHNTRLNKPEKHVLRLVLFVIFSAFVAASFNAPALDLTTLMVTGLSILTGFTFTALFSDHALAEAGLPKPITESEKIDIERLSVLSRNFRIRSEYFISLSVINVVILILLGIGIDPSVPAWGVLDFFGLTQSTSIGSLAFAYRLIASIFFYVSVFLSVAFFFENIYTFYRLTETTLAILNARRSYLVGRSVA